MNPTGFIRSSLITCFVLTGFLNSAAAAISIDIGPDYTIAPDTLDQGGGRTESSSYANHGSIGGITAPPSSISNFIARHGFIAQIHDAPTVDVLPATDLSRTGATLRASVNQQGLPSSARFEYGLTEALGNTAPATLVGGRGLDLATTLLSSLDPGTDYQFRIVAWNADGTVQGRGQTFTTVENLAPMAVEVTLERTADQPAEIQVADLLAGATDPEDDLLSFRSAADASEQGAEIVFTDGLLRYLPPDGFNENDSFTFTINDSFGAETSGTVLVVVREGSILIIRSIEILPDSGGQVRIRFGGAPGGTYTIQTTPDLGQPWVTVDTLEADGAGFYEFIDAEAPQIRRRFYRAIQD